jgi:hypothetical protein
MQGVWLGTCTRACMCLCVQGYVSVCVCMGMYLRGVPGGGMGGGGGGRQGEETTSHSQTVLQILSKTLIPLRLSLTTSSSTAVKNPICASGEDAQQALSRALFWTISSVSLPPWSSVIETTKCAYMYMYVYIILHYVISSRVRYTSLRGETTPLPEPLPPERV